MEWINLNCNNKLFWHITTKENTQSIQEEGIKQSITGQNKKGVYCIGAYDYDVLDSLIELMGQRGDEELYIVEFSYSGEYQQCDKNLLIYCNEGWVCIKQDIKKINKIINIKEV